MSAKYILPVALLVTAGGDAYRLCRDSSDTPEYALIFEGWTSGADRDGELPLGSLARGDALRVWRGLLAVFDPTGGWPWPGDPSGEEWRGIHVHHEQRPAYPDSTGTPNGPGGRSDASGVQPSSS